MWGWSSPQFCEVASKNAERGSRPAGRESRMQAEARAPPGKRCFLRTLSSSMFHSEGKINSPIGKYLVGCIFETMCQSWLRWTCTEYNASECCTMRTLTSKWAECCRLFYLLDHEVTTARLQFPCSSLWATVETLHEPLGSAKEAMHPSSQENKSILK